MSFGIDAEPVADDLLERGLVALALVVRAGEQRDRAAAIETDFGALGARRRGPLDGVGHADAAQLAALARFRAALLEALDVGQLQRLFHDVGEVAGVVGEGEPGLVRHRVRRDRVLPPQLRRIDAELVGGEIDHALDDVGGLGPAVAAIGPHRIGVGEHRGDVDIERRRLVDAGQRAEIADERLPADLQERADIGDDVHPQSRGNCRPCRAQARRR